MIENGEFPKGFAPLPTQVAGHVYDPTTNSIGILQQASERYIFKPLGKPMCGASEVNFYNSLKSSEDPAIIRLNDFVPKFFGPTKLLYNNKEVEFIKLENLTYAIEKPCVMDIKIGKRTWDPFASQEKIISERSKYAKCKDTLGFCLPGFQVHDIKTDELKRFGKKYGKQLNNETVLNAFDMFFNSHIEASSDLIRAVLNQLYDIHQWFELQTSLRFYSSSILIIYDAKRLSTLQQAKCPYNWINDNESVGKSEPMCTSMSEVVTGQSSHKKTNYSCLTNGKDSLKHGCNLHGTWVKVKMIDFAHVFPAEDTSLDTNYLLGIENLIKTFERYLKE